MGFHLLPPTVTPVRLTALYPHGQVVKAAKHALDIFLVCQGIFDLLFKCTFYFT